MRLQVCNITISAAPQYKWKFQTTYKRHKEASEKAAQRNIRVESNNILTKQNKKINKIKKCGKHCTCCLLHLANGVCCIIFGCTRTLFAVFVNLPRNRHVKPVYTPLFMRKHDMTVDACMSSSCCLSALTAAACALG